MTYGFLEERSNLFLAEDHRCEPIMLVLEFASSMGSPIHFGSSVGDGREVKSADGHQVSNS